MLVKNLDMTMVKKYDFDGIIDRRGSGCIKYDGLKDRKLIPMWIADMDFATPDFVIDAIRKRLECPVLGYPQVPADYYGTIAGWVRKLHGWAVEEGWLRYIPGIVKGIGLAQCVLLSKGDRVVIQPPVYHPFRDVSEKNGMKVLENPLLPLYDAEGTLTGYEMDLEGLRKCAKKGARMLILSNPQNPAGICWDRKTLEAVAAIASETGMIVVSDEIHAEMAHKGFTHIPYASVSKAAAKNSISFMAPSKTFNIAGIVSSYTIVPDPAMRKKFFSFLDANEIDFPSIFSIEAAMAAYRHGASWRRQMLKYVESNIDFVEDYLRNNIPQVKMLRPQASFLVWMDFRALGLPQARLMEMLEKKARIFLNDGTMFGKEGEGYARLNVGCPRSVLEQALDQLAAAVGTVRTARSGK